jgi:hypothetical protein
MQVPFWRDLAKWPSLPQAATLQLNAWRLQSEMDADIASLGITSKELWEFRNGLLHNG